MERIIESLGNILNSGFGCAIAWLVMASAFRMARRSAP